MITAIAFILIVGSVGALAIGWIVTERDIARQHDAHVARHNVASRGATYAPVEWPEYNYDCDICMGRS